MQFELDEDQEAKLKVWSEEQDRTSVVIQRGELANSEHPDLFMAELNRAEQPYYGAIGGELTFMFTPNSIGTVLKVKHGLTGNVIDLTDYDSW